MQLPVWKLLYKVTRYWLINCISLFSGVPGYLSCPGQDFTNNSILCPILARYSSTFWSTAVVDANIKVCRYFQSQWWNYFTITTDVSWTRGTSVCSPHHYLSHAMRKPVFGVSDQVRRKLACSTLETSWSLEILDLASIYIILSRQRTIKELIRLRGCAGWYTPCLFVYCINRFSRDVARL